MLPQWRLHRVSLKLHHAVPRCPRQHGRLLPAPLAFKLLLFPRLLAPPAYHWHPIHGRRPASTVSHWQTRLPQSPPDKCMPAPVILQPHCPGTLADQQPVGLARCVTTGSGVLSTGSLAGGTARRVQRHIVCCLSAVTPCMSSATFNALGAVGWVTSARVFHIPPFFFFIIAASPLSLIHI